MLAIRAFNREQLSLMEMQKLRVTSRICAFAKHDLAILLFVAAVGLQLAALNGLLTAYAGTRCNHTSVSSLTNLSDESHRLL